MKQLYADEQDNMATLALKLDIALADRTILGVQMRKYYTEAQSMGEVMQPYTLVLFSDSWPPSLPLHRLASAPHDPPLLIAFKTPPALFLSLSHFTFFLSVSACFRF